MKSAKIYMYDHYAGRLTEDENGFQFVYDSDYLAMEGGCHCAKNRMRTRYSSLSLTDWCQRDGCSTLQNAVGRSTNATVCHCCCTI